MREDWARAVRNRKTGLLSDGEIAELSAKHELISSHFEVPCLRGAAYNVRIAADGVVTPSGELFLPSHLEGGRSVPGPIILNPGETAELSSYETFHLPDNVAGNISIKTELAARGLLLLSGLMIDPGYGVSIKEFEKSKKAMDFDGRLHFFIANVGSEPVSLFPEVMHFASVQFFWVAGPVHAKRKRVGHRTAADWKERPSRSLGFISDLRKLKVEHDQMRRESAKTAEATKNLIVVGFFLIAATILGLTLNNLLSIGSDADLVKDIANAVPDEWEGKALIAALAFAVAWIAHSVALFFRTKPAPLSDGHSVADHFREEALTQLKLKRWRRMAWRAGLPLVPVATALVALFYYVDWTVGEAWAAPSLIAGVLVGYGAWVVKQWKPIREAEIRTLVFKLRGEQPPTYD